MTDDELRSMLSTWKAPPAPKTLRGRIFRRRRLLFRWLLSGEIRVPVPVVLAALCLLIFAAYRALKPSVSSLSDFEHVQQFQPRIVEAAHETR